MHWFVALTVSYCANLFVSFFGCCCTYYLLLNFFSVISFCHELSESQLLPIALHVLLFHYTSSFTNYRQTRWHNNSYWVSTSSALDTHQTENTFSSPFCSYLPVYSMAELRTIGLVLNAAQIIQTATLISYFALIL